MLNKDEKLNAPQTKLAKPPFTHCSSSALLGDGIECGRTKLK